MENNSQKKKTITQTMHQGFVRGLTGKEEDTSKARIIISPEPLPNEMEKYRALYAVSIICLLAGFIDDFFWGIGILGLMVSYCINISVADHKTQRLRRMKFKFIEGISNDDLFLKMQPIFISKYNWMAQKEPNGELVITYKKYNYIISINEDKTFVIWWRIPGIKAFAPLGKYKLYKNVISAMGIIAYEIQSAYNIQGEIK